MIDSIDTETFESFKRGNERALSIYFELFYPRLTLASWRITGNECESQQMAADALLKLFQSRDTIQSAKHSINFLYRVVINMSLSFLKHKAFVSKEEKEFLMDWDEIDDINIRLDVELVAKLTATIDTLPVRSKEVIKCIEIYHLSYARTAEIMHTTVKNVENMRTYAMKKMKAKMI